MADIKEICIAVGGHAATDLRRAKVAGVHIHVPDSAAEALGELCIEAMLLAGLRVITEDGYEMTTDRKPDA